MSHVIEKGIPLPPINKRVGWSSRYNAASTLKLMEVGDSFFLKDCILSQATNNFYKPALRLGMKVACRNVDGGVRVWRIK